jgi:hypothetical protein
VVVMLSKLNLQGKEKLENEEPRCRWGCFVGFCWSFEPSCHWMLRLAMVAGTCIRQFPDWGQEIVKSNKRRSRRQAWNCCIIVLEITSSVNAPWCRNFRCTVFKAYVKLCHTNILCGVMKQHHMVGGTILLKSRSSERQSELVDFSMHFLGSQVLKSSRNDVIVEFSNCSPQHSPIQIDRHFSLNTGRNKNGWATYLPWAIYLADHISRQPRLIICESRVTHCGWSECPHSEQHPLFYLWSPFGLCLRWTSRFNTFLWQWIPPFWIKKHLKLSLIPPLSEPIYT